MSVFVKLIKNLDDHKVGDVIQVDEAVARSYIELKFAEASNADEQLRSLVQGLMAEMTGDIKTQLDDVKRSIVDVKAEGPPSKGMKIGDDGMPFHGSIEGSSASVDRNINGGDTQSFRELLQLVFLAQSAKVGVQERSFADQRLKQHYVDGVTINHDDDSSQRRSFTFPSGVSRTGTESTGGGSWAGYAVKPEFVNTLFEIAIEEQVIEPYAYNIPVGQTNTIRWPVLDQYGVPTPGQSSTYAGVTVSRRREIDDRPESQPKLRNIEFVISDLTGMTYLSRDLVADGFLAADRIAQEQFGKAMAWHKDWEFLNETGVGAPLGIRNSPALLSVQRANANHVCYEDLLKMIGSFHMSCLDGAEWIANQSLFVELCSIKNSAGAYVFQPNAMLTQDMGPSIIGQNRSSGLLYAARGRLLGMPIRFTEKVPALGNAADLMLINPTKYGVATRQGLEVGMSEHFRFSEDILSFRFKIRNAGQPLWTAPYISADGSATKWSPFVQLV